MYGRFVRFSDTVSDGPHRMAVFTHDLDAQGGQGVRWARGSALSRERSRRADAR